MCEDRTQNYDPEIHESRWSSHTWYKKPTVDITNSPNTSLNSNVQTQAVNTSEGKQIRL